MKRVHVHTCTEIALKECTQICSKQSEIASLFPLELCFICISSPKQVPLLYSKILPNLLLINSQRYNDNQHLPYGFLIWTTNNQVIVSYN